MEVLKDRTESLRQDSDDLIKAAESLKQSQADLRVELLKKLTAKNDSLKDMIAEVRREATAANQKLENLTKHVDEWDRRWWGLVVCWPGRRFRSRPV